MTHSSVWKRGARHSALALGYAAAGFGLTLTLVGGMELSAQGIGSGFRSHNTNAPVDVDAGRIVAQNRQDRVVFSGNVVVRQANLTVRSARMQLNYLNSTELELQRITASGGVTVSRGNERATGSTAVYDFGRRIITLVGDVQLRQGPNSLSGERLVIDLDTGVSSVDGRSSGGGATVEETSQGRVKARFQPNSQGDAPSNPAGEPDE